MRSAEPISDNYGACPALEDYAFVVASTSATMVVEVIGPDGRSLTVPKTLTVTSTAQSIHTLLASASVTWEEDFMGLKIISVATAVVYYNYGAKLVRTPQGGSGYSYTASVVSAPTSSSCAIPVGDYSSAPWLAARVAGA